MPEFISPKISSVKPRWLLIVAIIFFALFFSAAIGLAVFNGMFKNKIYPNIFVGNINLGGLSAGQAKKLINQEVDKISQSGVIFSYKNNQTAIAPVIASADGDLAYQIINFNIEQTVTAALGYGRNGNFLVNLKNKLSALAVRQQLPLAITANQTEIVKILKSNFAKSFEPAEDAKLIIKKSPAGDFEFSVTKEKFGKTIDYEQAVRLLTTNLSRLNSAEIKLSTITQYPNIFSKDGLNLEAKAKKLLSLAPLILKYGENKWTIDQDRLSQFLALKPNGPPNDKINVALADDKLKDYLIEEVAPAIDKEPIEAKFEMKDGRIAEFQNGQDGLALNVALSLAKIENKINAALRARRDLPASPANGQTATSTDIELVVRTRPALTKTGDTNSFGIKELVGVGASGFAGSPVNRRHNIKIGGDSLNGLLIKPGEEFSLLKALGRVDASSGYLPELVIKENKTTPEFGGGLCQIGTTMFRAVIESGLPVTMRRNHSYRVGYYEPAGTDATIYDPWPDFRFINDTPAHILIQTKIASNTLAFEFWGSRDGRLTEKTKPTIYNIVKPAPTKIIETLDLKPGEKKCTEKAHNGADAYFDYKVTYADGQVKEKRFSSHYVPWREVCLMGVEKLSAPPDTATSSPPISEN